MAPAQLTIASDVRDGEGLAEWRARARHEEQAQRRRLRALGKARAAKRRAEARREALNARQWAAWSKWCHDHARAWHELRTAEAADMPARVDAARRRLREVTARMPSVPIGRKP
jgi:hypothetical protein